MAVLAGCGSESEKIYDEEARVDDQNCMEPATIGELEPPLDQYFEDSGITIDYERAAPYGNARKSGDGAYTKEIFYDPRSLEQVYYDAAEGNQQAKFLACFYDFSARRIGRALAQRLARIDCVAVRNCQIKHDKLPLSLETESGIRLLEQLWTDFEKEARRKKARWELFNNSMALFLGVKLVARVPSAATSPRPGPQSGSTGQMAAGTPATPTPSVSHGAATSVSASSQTATGQASVSTPATTTPVTARTPATTSTSTTSASTIVRSPTSATARSTAVTAAVSRGGAAPVRVGQQGEAAVRARYDIGDKSAIRVNGRTRIPDGIKGEVVSEVKNVKKLSLTRQIKDFMDYSRERDFRFDLYIRRDTKVSGPLDDARKAGQLDVKYIP